MNKTLCLIINMFYTQKDIDNANIDLRVGRSHRKFEL